MKEAKDRDRGGPAPLALGYLRQSRTEADEVESGASLSSETQLRKVAAYCEIHGYRLDEATTRACTDLDTSGGAKAAHRKKGVPSWQRRPGLARLYELARERAFAHLVVYDLSRLGRDAAELHQIRQAFADEEIAIHAVSEGVRSDTDVGELVFTMLSGVAQMERRNISRRVRDARRQRAEAGLHHGGNPPAWLDRDTSLPPEDPARWSINPFAATVRRLVALRLAGLPYHRIAATLNAEGLRTRRGKLWSGNGVYLYLAPDQRLVMRGCAVYGRRRAPGDPLRVVREGVLPPLLTPEESDALDAIQAALGAGHGQRGPYMGGEAPAPHRLRQSTQALCSGLMVCAFCGRAMVVRTSGEGTSGLPELRRTAYSYVCKEATALGIPHASSRPRLGGGNSMGLGAQKVDGAVRFALAALAARLPQMPPPPKPPKPRAAATTRTVEEINAAIDTLLDLLAAGRLRQGDYDRRYAALERERAQIAQREEQRRAGDEQARGLALLLETGGGEEEAEAATLRAALRLLVARIEAPVVLSGRRGYRQKLQEIKAARLVFKRPLPDGTVSILSGMYHYNYTSERFLRFEGPAGDTA